MSYIPRIEFFRTAKAIKKMYFPLWEKDGKLFAENMETVERENDTFDECLNKKDHEKYKNHLKIHKCDVGNLETEIPEINTLKLSEGTLCCFIWDMNSPLLNDDFDAVRPKFHAFKKIMSISNLETDFLEASRSSDVALKDKHSVPYFNKTEELYTVGEYKHLKNRIGCHIGVLIDKPHPERSIEENKLAQWHVDSLISTHLTKTSFCTKMTNELAKDTLHRRTESLKTAFKNMLTSVESNKIESDHVYNDIIIVVNPIMQSDDEYVEAITKTLTSLIKREIIFGILNTDPVIPKFKLLLLDYSFGYTCPDYYMPGEDVLKTVKEQVYNELL